MDQSSPRQAMQSQERPVHHDQKAARNRRRRTRLDVEQHHQQTVAAQQDKVRLAVSRQLALQQHQRTVRMHQPLGSKAISLPAPARLLHSRVETTEHAPPQVSRAIVLHATARLQVIEATVQQTGRAPITMGIMAGTIVGVRMDQELAIPIMEAMARARHQRIAEERRARSSDQGMDRHRNARLAVRIVGQDRDHTAQRSVLAVSVLVEVRVIKEIDLAQGQRITIMAQELKSGVHLWSKRNQPDRSRYHHRSS